MHPQRHVLLIGDLNRAEFARVNQLFGARPDGTVFHRADNVDAALHDWDGTARLDRIWVAPSYRGQISDVHMRQLVTRYPLAEVTVLVGSWLEGETRSGNAWLGAKRWYIDRVVPQCLAELHDARRRVTSVTQSSDEACLGEARRTPPDLQGLVLICAEVPADRRYLADTCQQAGLSVMLQSPDDDHRCETVRAVIYDAVADRARQRSHVESLRRRFPSSQLTVMVSFPRWDEIGALVQAGASHVLGKPFIVSDLWWCLAEVFANTTDPATSPGVRA